MHSIALKWKKLSILQQYWYRNIILFDDYHLSPVTSYQLMKLR